MPELIAPIYGAPCWVDLTTRGFEEAKAFYGGLFGWEFTDMGDEYGHYNIISRDGADLGGAMAFAAEFMPAETPNMWGIYFSVEDIEATLTDMKSRGAIPMMEPMQVGNQGKNVFFFDPAQSAAGLWQPMDRLGFTKFAEPGFPAWFELNTRNYDEAVKFYSETLGCDVGQEPIEGMRYATLNINGEPQSGICDATEFMQEGQPNAWGVYFLVENTDDAVAKVAELGGTVLMDPQDSPYGRMAVVSDPNGVMFSIID